MKKLSWPAIATILSILACYGTLAFIAALGAMGVAVSLNEGIWAGVIVAFAMLATALFLRCAQHRFRWITVILAAVGTAAITYAMFVSYSLAMELSGFALLVGAVWLDRRAAENGV